MTYRTGNHWGVTIVREGPGPEDVMGHHSGDELVAVVVNGDQALAERICTLLNGAHTPDVDHIRGAAEALALVCHMLDRACPPATIATVAVRGLLDRAAAELGLDEDAPSGPLSVPVSASQPQSQGSPRAEGVEATSGRPGITWACTRCNRELDGNPLLCPHCGYTVYRPIETGVDR